MKNEINKKEDQKGKKDDTSFYAAFLLGMIILAAVAILLKLIGIF
jgi:hypothetical protein